MSLKNAPSDSLSEIEFGLSHSQCEDFFFVRAVYSVITGILFPLKKHLC